LEAEAPEAPDAPDAEGRCPRKLGVKVRHRGIVEKNSQARMAKPQSVGANDDVTKLSKFKTKLPNKTRLGMLCATV
jgi:hypothetical protein